MEKNILIAGKDLPHSKDFVEVFFLDGNNVSVGTGQDEKVSLSEQIKVIKWNKNSAISARSLVIQAETLNGFLNDVIFYFDTQIFSQKYNTFSSDVCSVALDEMILSYQFLTIEMLERLEQRKEKCRLVFVLRSSIVLENPLVATAESAFATFAENIAKKCLDKEFASTLLVTGEAQSETMQQDTIFASWLKDYIEVLDARKNETKSTSWVKAGSKPPSGFSLFGR